MGQSFNDLEFLEELGRGGMGVVYKARQRSLDRLVAVKLLPIEYTAEPVRLARFLAEARAAASLSHPNIVQVYQVGECPAGNYFVMEYVAGRSLDLLIKRKRISPASAVALLVTVAEAVHFAHSRGIVHRDLKPANIMIDATRRPVVMDFGIVKFVGKASSLTQQGVLMGTPAYMSPEQAGESPDMVGPRSDVYSLGAILYTILTGQPPYQEDTALRTVLKVIGPEMPASVRTFRPDLPEALDRLCMKCLSKKAEDRHATAQSLAQELRRLYASLPASAGDATLEQGRGASTMVTAPPPLILVTQSTGRTLRISRPISIVGRSSECDIVVRAMDVSKQHCKLMIEEDAVYVEDLGSSNGTFVNGEPIRRARLHHKDRLRVADYEFLVRLDPSKRGQ